MRILHTSDWHLGKNLEGYSRIEEQERFIEDLIEIIEEKEIDLVLLAGDVYDNSNPPARAEQLFYKAVKAICSNGKRMMMIIAGNHDNPERLVAANPLAFGHGVIIIGTPKTVVPPGEYGNCKVIDSGEGFIEIEWKGEKAVILTLPYPSEKRLNEIFTEEAEEEERRRSYSERVGEIFSKLSCKYQEDTINLAVSHLFVVGGESSDSERPIELGGSLAVETRHLPEKAQYIALGHLHRPQTVKGNGVLAHYAGSPLQYSKSEIRYSKSAYLVDINPGQAARVEPIYFKNYKPIEVWRCENIEEAIEKCKLNEEKEIWVYLEIVTEEVISQEKIKEIKELKKDIIEIKPIIKGEREVVEYEDIKEKSMENLFKEFYFSQRGLEPDEEILKLFLAIAQEEEI